MLNYHPTHNINNNHNNNYHNNRYQEWQKKFPYKFPDEYRKIIRILSKCGYADEPNYDDILKALRDVAKNPAYKEDQYAVDHAPQPLSFKFILCSQISVQG